MRPALIAIMLAMPAHAGDRGAELFARCYACHSLDPAETGLPGPSLAAVIGRPAAAIDGFDYSPAMRAAAAAGLTWDEPTLDALIADPEALVPGTWMSFPGMADPDDRAALIAHIRDAVQ